MCSMTACSTTLVAPEGCRSACMCDIGLPLTLQQPHLPDINEESLEAQLRHLRQDRTAWSQFYSGPDPSLHLSSKGVAICTYWRCFRRTDGQQRHRLRAGVFDHASTSKRAHDLLLFRLGCYTLPSVTGRRAGIPRPVRLCPLCMHGVGDDKHLVFECSALNGIRLGFPTCLRAPTPCHPLCTKQAAQATRRHAFHH